MLSLYNRVLENRHTGRVVVMLKARADPRFPESSVIPQVPVPVLSFTEDMLGRLASFIENRSLSSGRALLRFFDPTARIFNRVICEIDLTYRGYRRWASIRDVYGDDGPVLRYLWGLRGERRISFDAGHAFVELFVDLIRDTVTDYSDSLNSKCVIEWPLREHDFHKPG